MTFLEVCLTGCIPFLVSMIFRMFVAWNRSPGFDVYGHLLFAKTLRQQGGGPYSSIVLPMVGASPHSQPLLWHWLVGRFNQDFVLRIQASVNPVIDSCFVYLLFLLSMHSGASLGIAMLVSFLYILTPMWFSSIAIGPRIAGLTPRLSSEVATNLFLMICLLPLGINATLVTLIGSILAWYVLSTSKFGLQAMLFLVPPIALLSSSYQPALSLVGGLLVTFVASRGNAIRMYKAQLEHLVEYCKSNYLGKMAVSNRNSFREIWKRRGGGISSYTHAVIYRMLRDNSYTSVLLKAPVVLLAVVGLLSKLTGVGGAYVPSYDGPVIVGIVVYFVVNLRPFLFLGEAERYINHVAYFVASGAVNYAVEIGQFWLLALILTYGFVYWLVECLAFENLKPKHLLRRAIEDQRIIDELNSLSPTVVLSYPFDAVGGAFRLGLQTCHKSIYVLKGCYTDRKFAADFEQRFSDGYPYVQLRKLDEMSSEYGIGYVVVDRKASQQRGGWNPSSMWEKSEVSGDVYAVYRRRLAN